MNPSLVNSFLDGMFSSLICAVTFLWFGCRWVKSWVKICVPMFCFW